MSRIDQRYERLSGGYFLSRENINLRDNPIGGTSENSVLETSFRFLDGVLGGSYGGFIGSEFLRGNPFLFRVERCPGDIDLLGSGGNVVFSSIDRCGVLELARFELFLCKIELRLRGFQEEFRTGLCLFECAFREIETG